MRTYTCTQLNKQWNISILRFCPINASGEEVSAFSLLDHKLSLMIVIRGT